MPVLVVSAEQREAAFFTQPLNAPTSDAITRAFNETRLSGNTRDRGDWISPMPRITRTDTVAMGGLREFTTRAANVYGVPTGGPWSITAAFQTEPARALADALAAKLNADVPGTWAVTVTAYRDAINGPLDWWAGVRPDHLSAANTTTRDAYPGVSSAVDVAENPIGPTTSATHPSTLAQVVEGMIEAPVKAAKDLVPWFVTGAIVTAVGTAYVYRKEIGFSK